MPRHNRRRGETVALKGLFKVTIHYVDEHGTKVAVDYAQFALGRTQFEVPSPRVDGMVPDWPVVKVNIKSSAFEKTVTYRRRGKR